MFLSREHSLDDMLGVFLVPTRQRKTRRRCLKKVVLVGQGSWTDCDNRNNILESDS